VVFSHGQLGSVQSPDNAPGESDSVQAMTADRRLQDDKDGGGLCGDIFNNITQADPPGELSHGHRHKL